MIAVAVDPMRVQEDARARMKEEFINLAADVSQINVCGLGVAHVRGRKAAEVDVNVWSARIAAGDPARKQAASGRSRSRRAAQTT